MIFHHIIVALAGLTLFLFSMIRLTDAVRLHVTSTRIRSLFQYAVKTPLYGLITGIIVTILFQSSSATSVLAVGLVSSGLISFFHSLGIILGADIGTTLTIQFVVWKITDISPLFIIAGGCAWFLGKERWTQAGEAVFFFGLMFFGLQIVSVAAEPLKDSPHVVNFFKHTTNPLLGALIGLGFTAIVQSSAVPIALLVILGQYDLITLEKAFPLVLGANLGTAVTAMLAGIVANIEGKRSALSHFLFKFVGVLLCLIFLSPLTALVQAVSSSTPQQIALGHFVFNALLALLFLPILGPFSRLVVRILPGKEEVFSIWPGFLDKKYLSDADTALSRVQLELERQMILARRMMNKAIEMISTYAKGHYRDIIYIEDVVDSLQKEISDYLRNISQSPLEQETSKRLFLFTSMVDDIERIADHAVNIAELAELKHRRNVQFSTYADSDFDEIKNLVTKNVDDALSLMREQSNATIAHIFSREERVDQLFKEAKERHLERYYKKICHAEAGPIFIDLLINLERVSDHCENIAEDFGEIKGK